MLNFLFSKKTFRRAGDKWRDCKAWSQAEAQYRRHLARQPDDAAIHIQLGHVLKEQSKFDIAAEAYLRGVELTGGDAELFFQLGWVLSRADKPIKAMAAFRKSFILDPFGGAGQERLAEVPGEKAPLKILSDGAVLFAIQDLFGYLKAHATFSGIQRVQAGIARHILEIIPQRAVFILNDISSAPDVLTGGEFWAIDAADLISVLNYAQGETVEHPVLRELILECEERAHRVCPGAGHTIMLLGAFWGHGNTVDRYLPSRARGARIGLYIYDIIPVTHPFFCDPPLVADFTRSLCEACFIADFALTISEYTKEMVAGFLVENGCRPLPMAAVPLAHLLKDQPANWQSSTTPAPSSAEPYAAYVSTIEGRKNHIYVVRVWQELIRRGVQVPDLLLVGRMGWEIEPLKTLLAETDNLDGRIKIVNGLSDADLERAYADSLFTLFTSTVEGWGLPVGESLVHGRPCIASRCSSIPEVGHDLVDYVDPEDLESGISVIGRMIQDEGYRNARAAEISADFKPRSWADVTSDFYGKLQSMILLPQSDLRRVKLCETDVFRPGSLAAGYIDIGGYAKNPLRLLFHDFYKSEADQIWMRGRNGTLLFETDLPPNIEIVFEVGLLAPAWAYNCRLVIGLTGMTGTRSLLLAPIAPDRIRIYGTTDADSRVGVSFMVDTPFRTQQDRRSFAVGIKSLAFVRAHDLTKQESLDRKYSISTMSIE